MPNGRQFSFDVRGFTGLAEKREIVVDVSPDAGSASSA